MKVDFLAAAQAEFEEAVSYFNAQSEGLGFEFAAEVKSRRNPREQSIRLVLRGAG